MTNVFHLSLYSLVAIAAMMLSMAEEAAFPTGLTVPAAMLALYLNEKRRSIRLRTLTANVLGVAAFALAGAELLYSQVEESGFAQERRVLAGAHLLSYLTWIALFQAKQGRQYWWLLALSVMHVAVGSILTQEGAFGVLILVYVFLALWTLSVFSLYQARFGFERADTDTALHDSTSTARRESWNETEMQLSHHRSDEFQGAIQLDPDEHWVNSRFVLGVLSTSLMSVGVGMVFFVLIPRVWVGRQYEFEDGRETPLRSYTGFTNEVQLGELGQILESNRPVMQVRCSKGRGGEELPVEQAARMMGFSEPLFRGSVMGRYENGRWHVLKESQTAAPLVPPRDERHFIQQRIIVHDSSTRTLFGLHPVFGTSFDTGLIRPRLDIATSILIRDDEDKRQKQAGDVEYLLYSRPRRRPTIKPYPGVRADRAREDLLPKFRELPDGLDRLRQLSANLDSQVNRFEQSDEPVDLRIAHRIEDYLGHNPDFTYSLRAEIVDASIDPVEDFLFNRKSGHCEYYASAMALLLRAANIPSRLVSGFKGGEQNAYTGAFVVEERHAHAWVEAYVDKDWRTFDPTPAAREESVREVGDERSLLSAASTFLTALWQQRIVRLSKEEQERQIYAPVKEVLKQMALNVSNLFGGDGSQIVELLSNPRRWFSVPMFVGTAIVLALGFGLKRLWRRLFPESRSLRDWIAMLRRALSKLFSPDEAKVRIEFYERFAKLLAREGLVRAASQTPAEFAETASQQLAQRLSAAELEGTPDSFASLFYQVRFGDKPLSAGEVTRLDSLLARLETAFGKRQA
jgi:transglutaminase-like putative cysteine protease